MNETTLKLLDAAALRITKESREYLGYWLFKTCDINRLTYEQLATKLGIDMHTLARLALCATPNPDPDQFSHDVVVISTYIGFETRKLVNLLRNMWAIEPWQPKPKPASTGATGSQMAADTPGVDEETPLPKTLPQSKLHNNSST